MSLPGFTLQVIDRQSVYRAGLGIGLGSVGFFPEETSFIGHDYLGVSEFHLYIDGDKVL